MRYLQMSLIALFVIALAAMSPAAVFGQAQDSPFSGNLDRPVSTWDARDTEGAINGDDKESGGEGDPTNPDDSEPPTFMGEPLPGSKIILVLDASGSMYAGYNPGYPVYNKNGGVISYPNRWTTTQSEAALCVGGMDENTMFDIIVYDTYVKSCFGALTKATGQAKGTAVSWIYACVATGCTNSYDALKLAFTNYGLGLDCVMFMSDGYPNTALTLGIGACAGWNNVETRILTDTTGWIAAQVAANKGFQFVVVQVGGSPMPFMVNLGKKQNSIFRQK